MHPPPSPPSVTPFPHSHNDLFIASKGEGDIHAVNTLQFVQDILLRTVPLGTISTLMGSAEPKIFGWYLCNGQQIPNNPQTAAFAATMAQTLPITPGWGGKITLPDLRNRFIVGAGDKYKVKDTGGSDTHTLTVEEIPSHKHDITIDQANLPTLYRMSDDSDHGNNKFDRGSGGAHQSIPFTHTHTANIHNTGGGKLMRIALLFTQCLT